MELDKEYLEIVKQIEDLDKERSESEIIELDKQIRILQEKRIVISDKYVRRLNPLVQRREEILNDFRKMYDGNKKRQYGVLNLSYRITKSLKILDPTKVVEALQKIDKVSNGINSFNLTFLRKLRDTEILKDDSVQYEEKVNIRVEENR